jgi:hypothetical protein
MNGAIAELCARTIRAPIRKRAASMGTSHHLLLLQKKANNSPTIPKRLAAVRAAPAMLMVFLRPILRFDVSRCAALRMVMYIVCNRMGYEFIAARTKVCFVDIQRFSHRIE